MTQLTKERDKLEKGIEARQAAALQRQFETQNKILDIELKREKIAQRRLVAEAQRDVNEARRAVNTAERSGDPVEIGFAQTDLQLAEGLLRDVLAGAALSEVEGRSRRQSQQLTQQDEAEDFLFNSSRNSLERLNRARGQTPQEILNQFPGIRREREREGLQQLPLTGDLMQFGEFMRSLNQGGGIFTLPNGEQVGSTQAMGHSQA